MPRAVPFLLLTLPPVLACTEGEKTCETGEGCDTSSLTDGVGGVESDGCGEGGSEGSTELPLATEELAAGSFSMGSPAEESGRRSDEIQHTVVVDHALVVGRFEVSQAQFQAVMAYNPSNQPDCPSCPVENVDWHEAAAFAAGLSVMEGLEACYTCSGEESEVECTPSADPYACSGWRLPSEVEWEYAARGGTAAVWSGGDEPGRVAWTVANTGRPCPGGAKRANEYGLYDMSGNVWEWTAEAYGAYDSLIETPAHGAWGSSLVIRGGSWYNPIEEARVAARRDLSADLATPFVGLRLVRNR